MSTSYQLVQRQAELWKATIQDAEGAWKSLVSDSNDAVSASLKGSFAEVVHELQAAIGKNIAHADDCMSKRWEQWQVMLSDNARAVAGQQTEMVRQSEALNQLLEQIQSVKEMQATVDQNPGSVMDENRLADTLQQLCTAISQLRTITTTTDNNVDTPRRGKLGIFQGDSSSPTGWKSGARPISVETFVSNNKAA